MATDKYQILGVSRNASVGEIRAAYLRLAGTRHPDLNPGNAQAESEFKSIQLAYETLVHPRRRHLYDIGGPADTVFYAHDQRWRPPDDCWPKGDISDRHFYIRAGQRGPRTILQSVIVAGLCLLTLASAGFGVYWMSESMDVTTSLGMYDLRDTQRIVTHRRDDVDNDVVSNEDVVSDEDDASSVDLREQDRQDADDATGGEASATSTAATTKEAETSAIKLPDDFVMDGFADQENPLVTAALEQISFQTATDMKQSLPDWQAGNWQTGNWQAGNWQATTWPFPENVDLTADSVAVTNVQIPAGAAGEIDFANLVAVSVGPDFDSVARDLAGDDDWSSTGLPAAPRDADGVIRPWEPSSRSSVGEPDNRIPDMSLANQLRRKRARLLGMITDTSSANSSHPTATTNWNSTPTPSFPTSPSLSSLYPTPITPNSLSPNARYRRPPTTAGLQATGQYAWDPVTGSLQTGTPAYATPRQTVPPYHSPNIPLQGYYMSPAIYSAPSLPSFNNGVAYPTPSLTPYVHR